MKKIEILDCTLRDGSYVIDNYFTRVDTSLITSLLFKSGIKLVEVGHGMGLGASSKKFGYSLYKDEDYIESAVLTKEDKLCKVGSFFFPFIGDNTTIKSAKNAGLDFLRVGVDLENIHNSKKTIEYAKSIGLKVFANLVKSYSIEPKALSQKALKLTEYGADVICLVDSAGGMTPDEIIKYFKILRDTIPEEILLNFHGHNNLGLANANCLAAIDGGATIVDSSIMGMGRSSGNAITEMLVAIFQRKKILKNKIDLNRLLHLAKNVIAELNTNKVYSPDEILFGKNFFHSSFQKKLKIFCKKNNFNYLEVLNNLNFKKIKKFDEIQIKNKLKKIKIIKKEKNKNITKSAYKEEITLTNTSEIKNLREFSELIKTEKKRKSSEIAITICRGKNKKIIYKNLYYYLNFHIAHIESPNTKTDKIILEKFKKENCFIDKKINYKNFYYLKDLQQYDESEIAKQSVMDFINLTKKYSKILNFTNLEINKNKIQQTKKRLIICKNIDLQKLRRFKFNYDILLVGKMKFSIEILKEKLPYLNLIIKPNYGLALTLDIIKKIKLKEVMNFQAGKKKLSKDILLVSGGIIGPSRSIIVNNINRPTKIIGIADGFGNSENKKINSEDQIKLNQWFLEKLNND